MKATNLPSFILCQILHSTTPLKTYESQLNYEKISAAEQQQQQHQNGKFKRKKERKKDGLTFHYECFLKHSLTYPQPYV